MGDADVTSSARRPGKWTPAQAVSRPMQILEAVSLAGSAASAQQIVAATSIPVPSVYRLIGALLAEGYLERSPETSGFQLGPKVAAMAEHFVEQQAWPAVLEALHRAEQILKLPVVAAVHGHARFHLPAHQAGVLGDPERWHACALGKLLVAYRRDLLAQLTFTPFTPHSHRGPVPLVQELDVVVEQRISYERQEVELSRHAVAAAVMDPAGNLAGALCVPDLAEDSLDSAAESLAAAASHA